MIVATFNAWAKLSASLEDLKQAIGDHLIARWGPITDEQRRANANAICQGGKILSVHKSCNNVVFHVLTEIGKGQTLLVVCLPGEE